MLYRVNWQIVTDVSKGRVASSSGSSRVTRLGMMRLLEPEDEGNTILWNPGNYLPKDMASKPWNFSENIV
jgi:hypothetical protein